MSWINRALGHPEPDPTGRDRALFRKIGSEAAIAFFSEDFPKATSIVERWMNRIASKFGQFHPDIGRSATLMAIFQTMYGQTEKALELASMGRDILRPLGVNNYDFQAADDLATRLEAKIAGSFQQSPDNPLIGLGSPIGDFLDDLKPRK